MRYICGSMDVKALYPSIDMSGQAFYKSIIDSKLECLNINTKQLVRYVALRVKREKVVKIGVGGVVPEPRKRTTFNSFINPRGTAKLTGGDSQFFPNW